MNHKPIVSFVILHFLNTGDTIECIESIKTNIDYSNYFIVLVDNGSPDGSGKLLQEQYKDDKQIIVLLNKKNLGFAKGNNTGYSYAKETLKSDFIVVINNDVVIDQRDFIDIVLNKYRKYQFHIAGPDIISLADKGHQNPRVEALKDEKSIKGYIKTYRIMYWLSLVNLDNLFLRIKKYISPLSRLPSAKIHELLHETEREQVKLHGSALIFSPLFIKQYDYCFYPDTYMYCEESILNYIATRDKLKTLYTPALKLFHKEDGATNRYLKNARKKRCFYYKHFAKSSAVLLKLIQENDISVKKDADNLVIKK
jgi:GT2 family glycosyltransferase